jgi:hypothetical protein
MRMMRVPRVLFDWLDFRRSLAIIVVVLGGYVAYVYRLSRTLADHPELVVSGAVTVAPIAGFLIAPALIGLVFGMVDFVDERVWTPWQGIYHAFDDHQIRVVEARGILWFCSDDVHAALGMKRRAGVMRTLRALERHHDPEAGEMLSNAGLIRVLGKSTDRSTLRFLAWAERDVQRQWQRQRAGASIVGELANPTVASAPTPPPRDAHP